MTLQKRCAGSKAAKSARKVFRQENVAGDTTGGYEDVPVPDSESCRFRCIGSITKIKEGLFGPGAAANRSLGDIYVRIDAAKTGASEEEVRGI